MICHCHLRRISSSIRIGMWDLGSLDQRFIGVIAAKNSRMKPETFPRRVVIVTSLCNSGLEEIPFPKIVWKFVQ